MATATKKKSRTETSNDGTSARVEELEARVDELTRALESANDALEDLVAVNVPIVHLDGVDANPLSLILKQLLEETFVRAPWRRHIVEKMRGAVGVTESEADASCTLRFGGRAIYIQNGIVEPVDVHIEGDMASINLSANLKIPSGFFTADGLEMLRRMVRGQVVIAGMARHPLLSLRLMKLLSVRD